MAYIQTKFTNREDWLKDRKDFIGCSEVAAVLETVNYKPDKYKSKLRLYLEKIGEPIEPFHGNPITEEGKKAEPEILDMFQYWDFSEPTNEKMWQNYHNGNKLREITKEDLYYQNTDYNWLRGSIDGYYLDNVERIGAEAKNTTSLALNEYTKRINPAHYIQIQSYMLVTGWKKWILCLKIDGNKRENLVFEQDLETQKHIIIQTARFWENVLNARSIKEQYGIQDYYTKHIAMFDEDQKEAISILQSIEPDLSGHNDELEVLTEFYKKKEELQEMPGSQHQWDLIRQYLETQQESKVIQTKEQLIWAEIISSMEGASLIRFDEGTLSFKPDSAGRMRKHISESLKTAIRG